MPKLKLVVLGSTRGTNMQAIIDAINSGEVDASIDLVISNKKDAFILQRAKDNDITYKFIGAKNKSRKQYDDLLITEINSHNPDLILLVGFMRILSDKFTNEFAGKILNVHPSLLPKHSGLMDLAVHQSVLDAGDEESGCTIHQVNEMVDSGKIELQLKCTIEQNETVESLKQKVQVLESKAWVEVIKGWGNK